MPSIEQIPEIFYTGLQPYHHHYDNLPLRNIITRQRIINAAVDQQIELMNNAIGTAGTLQARLDQSLEEDGALKTNSIDAATHNIGAHEDGEWEGEDYVRMLLSERDKLELIADEATDVSIQVQTPSTTVDFESGIVKFEPSSSIEFQVVSPNIVRLHTVFPLEIAHNHNYDLEPVSLYEEPDYTNYQTTSIATPFIENSLKIYVNGICLSSSVEIPVYSVDPSTEWIGLSYTSDYESGTFALSRAIDPDDVIRIDFDTSYSS